MKSFGRFPTWRNVRPARALAWGFAAGLVVGAVGWSKARERPVPRSNPSVASVAPVDGMPLDARLVSRGEYLVTILACNDCHTPWVEGPDGAGPDMTRRLSGHPESVIMPEPPNLGDDGWAWMGAATNTAFAGPWGVSYAFNLTPDENTGLGIWTLDMFKGALRTGKHFGVARDILPPMPWHFYGKMTDEDIEAVYTYLRSIPPVHNRVPEPIVAETPQM